MVSFRETEADKRRLNNPKRKGNYANTIRNGLINTERFDKLEEMTSSVFVQELKNVLDTEKVVRIPKYEGLTDKQFFFLFSMAFNKVLAEGTDEEINLFYKESMKRGIRP